MRKNIQRQQSPQTFNFGALRFCSRSERPVRRSAAQRLTTLVVAGYTVGRTLQSRLPAQSRHSSNLNFWGSKACHSLSTDHVPCLADHRHPRELCSAEFFGIRSTGLWRQSDPAGVFERLPVFASMKNSHFVYQILTNPIQVSVALSRLIDS